MTSSITWVAHDPDEQSRVDRILASLSQGESRDELGLGGVRDSLADRLFPGTSTIQTRLRYFFIVPWCYRHIERQGLPAPRFGKRVHELERSLIPVLKDADADGVFGRVTGAAVKRLPSPVYWNGLGQWGIRRARVSQATYEHTIEHYHRRSARVRKTDDGEEIAAGASYAWHPNLPEPPEDFTERLDFCLTAAEASFLRDRIREHAGGTLLDLLAHAPSWAPDVEGSSFPWMLACFATLPEDTWELLEHARRVSEVAHGAAQLYNLQLSLIDQASDKSGRLAEIEQSRRDDLRRWRKCVIEPQLQQLEAWDLDRTRELCEAAPGHTIRTSTWTFLRSWRDRVVSTRGKVADDFHARNLVRQREQSQKGRRGRSRFQKDTMRAQWKGGAGLTRLDFRWTPARRLLRDLYAATGEPA